MAEPAMNVLVYVIVSMAALEDLVKHAKVYDVLKYNIVNLPNSFLYIVII